jgi:concanavalin A-like lectin/glucanase superfamily protein/type IX secretion system substrate protein
MNKNKTIILANFIIQLISILVLLILNSIAQQININRIELMPNEPAPYGMRNWNQVALGYDSLVFDFNQNGQYLPLIWQDANGVNYPNHDRFGLHTVVGTTVPNSAEAINVLAAVVSASLAGIDKSNQNSENWVLMCEEFFNRRPVENVYLNGPISSSGYDWWYDTMPNIFFYQLYDMYPNTGDFAYQFSMVADRWMEAVIAMGGNSTPWQQPYMYYRGWYLETMTPNNSGVREPEAAGAIAWLLYNAFVQSGNEQYRVAAEWALEYLNNLSTNPSYELQLPYGAYVAARMNAEIGTNYDVEKMVNWCFEVGPLRSWGAIVGNWGGYDCSGLIGEVSSNDYAFIMNGFEQVGALVPMVRYDDRFARAIGKWVLNIANASRLFYPNYLPDENQDSEAWAHQYDPKSYIAHEAMRENLFGFSPYATGDAFSGGWGATNLTLYGSSHVGIFGGIIDTTNIDKILKLDALRTDYFHDLAYPTYLVFNPYLTSTNVAIDAGSGQYDIYDAVSNAFLQNNVTGNVSINITADEAALLVIFPTGGAISYDLDKMLVDGIVVDYRSGQNVANYPPRIKILASNPVLVMISDTAKIYCTTFDRDSDPLNFTWSANAGIISGDSSDIIWTAPNSAGNYYISCTVDDGNGGLDSSMVSIEVIDNQHPTILSIVADHSEIGIADSTLITCLANDPDGDSLSYIWNCSYGNFIGNGSTVTWISPDTVGLYYITCLINDGNGGQDADSIGIVVGKMVAFYPFNGNANDESGFENNGNVSGATPVDDRFGNANSAYYFDGTDDFIRIANHPSLNNRKEITVNFWINVNEFFAREAYPISHGNWENRWKASITNQRVRWTIKTDTTVSSGIKDLDSQTQLILNSLYNVTLVYDGTKSEIYLNGVLDASSAWGGLILPTNIDLTIGQHLPGNNSYNFKGILDDIRIYNYALSQQEIQNLYTSVESPKENKIPDKFSLKQNYPNPFNPSTKIEYILPKAEQVKIEIFNLLGQKIKTLINKQMPAGSHEIEFTAKDLPSGVYLYRIEAGEFQEVKKMVLLK